ncbi:MAG: hypothetical protein IIZ80_05080 [Erysipelotrichaceae bacterium]|nr:hypothetical protein [Erysipelotrichaceae bacterium]
MNFLSGLGLKGILLILLAAVIVFGIVRKLFKLAIIVAIVAALYLLYYFLI